MGVASGGESLPVADGVHTSMSAASSSASASPALNLARRVPPPELPQAASRGTSAVSSSRRGGAGAWRWAPYSRAASAAAAASAATSAEASAEASAASSGLAAGRGIVFCGIGGGSLRDRRPALRKIASSRIIGRAFPTGVGRVGLGWRHRLELPQAAGPSRAAPARAARVVRVFITISPSDAPRVNLLPRGRGRAASHRGLAKPLGPKAKRQMGLP